MRSKAIVTLIAGASIAASALAGCSSEPVSDGSVESGESTGSIEATASERPTPTSDLADISIPDDSAPFDDAAEPWESVVTGFEGTPAALGDWVITVVESEYGRATDDVSVPGGMTRLEIEIDVENQGSAAAAVLPQDWSLTDRAGGRYAVLPAQQPEKQGAATIGSRDTEDVTVSFAVPGPSERHVLRFQPLGSVGALEVSLR